MSWVVAMLVLYGPLVAGKDTATTLGTNSAKRPATNRHFSAILNICGKISRKIKQADFVLGKNRGELDNVAAKKFGGTTWSYIVVFLQFHDPFRLGFSKVILTIILPNKEMIQRLCEPPLGTYDMLVSGSWFG